MNPALGKSTTRPTVDLLYLFFNGNGYEFLVLDFKSSPYGSISFRRGDVELDIAVKGIKQRWKQMIQENKDKLDLSRNYPVWLDNFIVYKDLEKIVLVKSLFYRHERIKLGKIYNALSINMSHM